MVPGPGEWFCRRRTLQRGKLEMFSCSLQTGVSGALLTSGSICIMQPQEEQKEGRMSARGTWVLVTLLERGHQAMVSFTLLPMWRSSKTEDQSCQETREPTQAPAWDWGKT